MFKIGFGLLKINTLIILAVRINMQFEKVNSYIQQVLKTEISPFLVYHSLAHTLGVLDAAIEIAKEENITNENDLIILKTAAIFHDCGFINVYDHEVEEEACLIAKRVLPGYEYSADQIEQICKLILKTKIPQQPETQLEKILCDADLNYLGDNDYEIISNRLFLELNSNGKNISEKEWLELQIDFLERHHFWTNSCIVRNEQKKQEHLSRLKNFVLV